MNDNEININTKSPEFIDWQWVDINLVYLDLVVEFKKHIYEEILKELKKIID